MKLGEAIYKSAQEKQPQEASSAEKADDSKVVDADFEEVREDEDSKKN
jgi:molecular chaperone DnaK